MIRGLEKTAARGEPARVREVEEVHPGRHTRGARGVADRAVAVERRLVETAALGLDATPLDREPVVAEAEARDELQVRFGALPEAVAGIRRHATGARGVHPVVRDVAALGLERRGRDAPRELRPETHGFAR